MIFFDKVSKRYPGREDLFSQAHFTIKQGEFILVTGVSGAGKSTLLKLIAGIERPSNGTVLINQQNISHLSVHSMPHLRRLFGIVFQDHKLLYDRNCFQNVLLPLSIHGVTGEDAARRVRAALDKVGLSAKEKAMPITLSGGEQQRLAIARAVVSRPEILIADEPTGGLDHTHAQGIMNLFKTFHEVGVTVIVAMHDTTQIGNIEHRVLHIHQQTLTELNPYEDVV